jgi:hypothetical protein
MLMALVHAENGVVKSEFLWPKCCPCNDTLFSLEVLVRDDAALQKVDVSWSPELCTQRNWRSKGKRWAPTSEQSSSD